MEVISENVIDTAIGKVMPMVDEAVSRLVECGGKLVDEVQKDFVPLLEDLVKNLTGEIKGIAFGKEVDELDMATLVGFAKQYVVESSNEIVAMKMKQEDGIFVYLAYSKDRQLLSHEDNRYLIIKAQTLAKDVEALFAESELIILK
ncbi:MAG: hypothetical protein HUK00_09650 [Bacteroidaceae bacterium]|nr:hypothetical protein [Bacteroidaceae bacterium]